MSKLRSDQPDGARPVEVVPDLQSAERNLFFGVWLRETTARVEDHVPLNALLLDVVGQ